VDISPGIDPLATLALPAGKFVVTAKAQFNLDFESAPTVECRLEVGGVVTDQSAVQLNLSGPSGVATLPLSGVASLSAPDVAELICQGDNVLARRVKLTAIQVETLSP